MIDVAEATGRNSLGRTGSPRLVAARLLIGLLQGLALWWLYWSAESFGWLCDLADQSKCLQPRWPATVPELLGPLSMILVMVPVLLLAGVGRMRTRTLVLWIIGATAFLALLGWHGVAAQSGSEYGPTSQPPFLPWPMPLFAAAALFIGHHLILPADMERKRIAAFSTYFDTAWKAGVQLALSIGFTGAFWILLFLGAALFEVIGLDFLQDLIGKEWFSIPVTCLMFSVAVHLTDVRDGLIRGVRSVVLMLLSWLLLLMTVLAAGFLAALPFTGLDGLWETGSATALVLSAAAALIILINTAYQDGRADNLPPVVLRVAVRVAAVLLTPLVILAFWGLALRIGQHGLTPDRIIAFACAVIGAAYAAGYGYGALRPFWRKGSDWMQPLEHTNVVTAVIEVAVILALFSPIADPARLSVADQVARLERGAVTPDKFDYRFLRFESGRTGVTALAALTRSDDAEIARRAKAARALDDRWHEPGEGRPERTPTFEVVGGPLPAGFIIPVGSEDGRYGCSSEGECVAMPLDMDGDGVPEILVAQSYNTAFWVRGADGRWSREGFYTQQLCPRAQRTDPRDVLRSGQVRTEQPRWPNLALGNAPSILPALEDRLDCSTPDSASAAPAATP